MMLDLFLFIDYYFFKEIRSKFLMDVKIYMYKCNVYDNFNKRIKFYSKWFFIYVLFDF